MTTKTRSKKKTKPGAKTSPAKLTLTAEEREYIDHLHEEGTKPLGLEIERLFPSPTNPRKHFDQAELLELAESYRGIGIVQPVTVRPAAGAAGNRGERFEVVAGERRYRAAKLAGLTFVPCLVRELDDQQVLRIQMIENLQRQDLNPIEEAEGFAQLCRAKEAGGGGYTQTELAKELGISQGQIANRIRLLELPEPWRGRVISREIPATHARALVPWAGQPAVLEKFRQVVARRHLDREAPPTDIWQEWIEEAVEESTSPVHRRGFVQTLNTYVDVKLTPKEIAANPELGIIEFEGWNGKEQRATNVKLAKKLLSAKFSAAVKAKGGGDAKLNATKDQVVRDRQQAADKFHRDLAEWRANWLRWLCARRLSQPPKREDPPIVKAMPLKLLLLLSQEGCWNGPCMPSILARYGVKARHGQDYELLSKVPPEKLVDVAVDLVVECLCGEKDGEPQPCEVFAYGEVDGIARDLGIDIAAAWKVEKAGPFTEGLFALLSVNQLSELADDWGLEDLDLVSDRKTLTADLLAAGNPKPLPRVLQAKKPCTASKRGK